MANLIDAINTNKLVIGLESESIVPADPNKEDSQTKIYYNKPNDYDLIYSTLNNIKGLDFNVLEEKLRNHNSFVGGIYANDYGGTYKVGNTQDDNSGKTPWRMPKLRSNDSMLPFVSQVVGMKAGVYELSIDSNDIRPLSEVIENTEGEAPAPESDIENNSKIIENLVTLLSSVVNITEEDIRNKVTTIVKNNEDLPEETRLPAIMDSIKTEFGLNNLELDIDIDEEGNFFLANLDSDDETKSILKDAVEDGTLSVQGSILDIEITNTFTFEQDGQDGRSLIEFTDAEDITHRVMVRKDNTVIDLTSHYEKALAVASKVSTTQGKERLMQLLNNPYELFSFITNKVNLLGMVQN